MYLPLITIPRHGYNPARGAHTALDRWDSTYGSRRTRSEVNHCTSVTASWTDISA